MIGKRQFRIFQFVLMTYLVAAFSWWTILLYQKNREVFNLKMAYADQTEKELLQKEYQRSQRMIIGEGLVFAISILISLLLINRTFWTEIKANKKLNNFLLSVTHELKTPIASLRLIFKTLGKSQIPEDKKQDLLDTAGDETLRLESLVNNILTVTQMDNNYIYNYEQLDLESLVSERGNRFARIYPDFQFDQNTGSDEFRLRIDRESIVKLLDNLIDNAIKYSGDRKYIGIDLTRDAHSIRLSVRDQGIGIADNEKKHVTEKFYRVGDEDTRISKGTGLGLFIVNEICKAHNARLSIEDNLPQGTIFTINFLFAK